MTLKDKKNKREYQNKLKAQGGVKENEKPAKAKDKAKPSTGATSQAPVPVSNVAGVAENAEKLIAEANKRYLALETQQEEEEDPKYAKRNITSNWTKYELPSSDEEDDSTQSMTGADFHYVLASAQGADSHFRLKSEREWESQADSVGELSQEFFSLDLSELEKSVSYLPLHQQICLAQEEFDTDLLDRLLKKAEAARGGSVVAAAEAEAVISQKIMDILNVGKEDTPKEIVKEEMKKTNSAQDIVVAEPLEQRQFRKGNVTLVDKTDQKSCENPAQEEKPLGQRTNRRQRGSKNTSSRIETAPVGPNPGAGEEEKDLEFIHNLEEDKCKAKVALEVKDSPPPIVTPVNIVSEETRNLEDWLDDFLDA